MLLDNIFKHDTMPEQNWTVTLTFKIAPLILEGAKCGKVLTVGSGNENENGMRRI